MKERIIRTLLELMEMESDNLSDKGPIIDYASRRLKEIGMKVSVTGPKDTPAIFASSGEGGLIMSGHLDTVPIGSGWSRMQGESDGDKVFGRGVSDMKGAVAVNLEVAEILMEEGVPFSVFLTTDEEEAMLGALKLSELELLGRAGGIIIGEPTGMRIVAREKGVLRLKLTARGKAGHSSQPWLGDNAIMKMLGILSDLKEVVQSPREATEERTAAVTTIKGGTKNNVIPESCTVEIDIRFPPWESMEDARTLIEERLVSHDCEMESTAELDSFEPPISSAFIEEAQRFLGTTRFPAAFATEAARFASQNAEIVICGPGTPGTCHIVDEWVDVGELEKYYDFVVHMARFVAQG